jgi:hypothetical protein
LINSLKDPVSKIAREKWTQAEECLLCKLEALSSNPSPHQRGKKMILDNFGEAE